MRNRTGTPIAFNCPAFQPLQVGTEVGLEFIELFRRQYAFGLASIDRDRQLSSTEIYFPSPRDRGRNVGKV
jgi:hypothetical protein